jgi:hypothetical protein
MVDLGSCVPCMRYIRVRNNDGKSRWIRSESYGLYCARLVTPAIEIPGSGGEGKMLLDDPSCRSAVRGRRGVMIWTGR